MGGPGGDYARTTVQTEVLGYNLTTNHNLYKVKELRICLECECLQYTLLHQSNYVFFYIT